jgi:hypothetical protein
MAHADISVVPNLSIPYDQGCFARVCLGSDNRLLIVKSVQHSHLLRKGFTVTASCLSLSTAFADILFGVIHNGLS